MKKKRLYIHKVDAGPGGGVRNRESVTESVTESRGR